VELLLALGIGVLIGLALGALGGGGSILTVPALVYLLGESGQAATAASLVIVGVSAAIGAVSYARDRQVRWSTGFLFAGAGLVATYAGSQLNRAVPQGVLLACFAILMVGSGTAMLVKSRRGGVPGSRSDRRRRSSDQPVRSDAASLLNAGAVGAGAVGGSRAQAAGPGVEPQRPPEAPGRRSFWRRSFWRGSFWHGPVLRIVVAGLVVGFLTGFLGVGGGFLIVPVLTMLLGYRMNLATGTSLLIISLNSAIALAARAGGDYFDWRLIVPVTLAAVVGSLLGKRIAHRLPNRVLTRGFAVFVILVAAAMGLAALL
jgi:uncharacterized protein